MEIGEPGLARGELASTRSLAAAFWLGL
ncbi:hypothetical protein CCACVL1_23750 [Corchorus capsularis]|uniref:Uncharacterized protein n=1 Tax=Corchorus capsularis TaxID=210143 RepID=A0A1R3GSU0_COCAP|nr:hypothetical protein CCACVL1_23750 [Corchorus capsularis]